MGHFQGAIPDKATAASEAKDTKAKAQDAISLLQANIADKEQQRRSQIEALKKSRESYRETEKWKRLVAMSGLLQQLVDPKNQLRDAEKILSGNEITKLAIDRLLDLERRRDIAIATRNIHFSHFTVSADKRPANIDGTDLPNGEPRLIDKALNVSLPGFGTMALEPADGVGLGIADPEALQSEITADLRTLGFDTTIAAHQAFVTWQTAMQDYRTAKTQIRALAPDGVDTIANDWDALCAELKHPKDKPAKLVIDTVQEDTSEIKEKEISNLDEDLAKLREDLPALQGALAIAAATVTELGVILNRLRADEADLVVTADEAVTLKNLVQEKKVEETEMEQARTALKNATGCCGLRNCNSKV